MYAIVKAEKNIIILKTAEGFPIASIQFKKLRFQKQKNEGKHFAVGKTKKFVLIGSNKARNF